jgi:uncharacterized protein YcfJ
LASNVAKEVEMKTSNHVGQIAISLIAVISLSACASQGGYRPTVDPYQDPNAASIDRDQYECGQLAHQASGGTATETVKGAVVGGLLGAAAGAALGAALGDPGTGAAVGAASGGFLGGTKQGLEAEEQYKHSYNNCMRGRGHRVINS